MISIDMLPICVGKSYNFSNKVLEVTNISRNTRGITIVANVGEKVETIYLVDNEDENCFSSEVSIDTFCKRTYEIKKPC